MFRPSYALLKTAQRIGGIDTMRKTRNIRPRYEHLRQQPASTIPDDPPSAFQMFETESHERCHVGGSTTKPYKVDKAQFQIMPQSRQVANN